jgi:energy-converting hydrogenase Eha subunit G
MKLRKHHFLLIPAVIAGVCLTVWLAEQWRGFFASPPPWLNQVIMTMVDPSLPLSVQLRESALKVNR